MTQQDLRVFIVLRTLTSYTQLPVVLYAADTNMND